MYNAEVTKANIMEQAIKLFAEKGFQGTSTADVVQAAGCSKGAFYYHFPSKEALIEETFYFCHNAIEAAAEEGIDELPSIVDQLCRRCYNLTKYALCHPDIARVDAGYQSLPVNVAKYEGSFRGCFRHYEVVMSMIETGLANGELRQMPAELLGEFFAKITTVPYTYVRKDPKYMEDEKFWAGIYDIIRCALAEKP